MTDPLRSRLSTMLRERGSLVSGVAAPITPPPSVNDWTARIDSLRAAQRVRDGQHRQAERALPGIEIVPGVRLIESSVALVCDPGFEPLWEADSTARGPLLYLDTETTGLAGGSGTLVFMLGLAWQDADHLRIQQWLLCAPGSEREWLTAIAAGIPRPRSVRQSRHLSSRKTSKFRLARYGERDVIGLGQFGEPGLQEHVYF